jgi:tRNA1(Val) A37 N6-methylase TrmN6
MSPDASLWVILPVKESVEFIEKAEKSGLFLHSKLKIIPKAGKECHRNILHVKKGPVVMIVDKILAIKNIDGSFTKEYMELMNEFYIDF